MAKRRKNEVEVNQAGSVGVDNHFEGDEQNKVNKNKKTGKHKKADKADDQVIEAHFSEDNQDNFMSINAENDNFSEVESSGDEDEDQSRSRLSTNNNATIGKGLGKLSGRKRKTSEAATPGKEAKKRGVCRNISEDYDLSEGEISDKGRMIDLIETRADYVHRSSHKPASQEIDDRIRQEIISETVAKMMKQLMMAGRLVMDKEMMEQRPRQQYFDKSASKNRDKIKTAKQNDRDRKSHLSISELTIYHRAVPDETGQLNNSIRFSSFSEEADTSDEHIMIGSHVHDYKDVNVNQFINSVHADYEKRRREAVDDVVPGTSGYQRQHENQSRGARTDQHRQEQQNPEEIADNTIREVEQAKGRVFDVPGERNNQLVNVNQPLMAGLLQNYVHSMFVDKNYCLVAAHIDATTKAKIVEGQYVDFSKLVSKDRVWTEEDHRVQLIMKGGSTYFVPANNGSTSITSIHRWDQAFHVFSEIYCKAHPNRATELIQYCHVIHTAAVSYLWDNVYAYNSDFRLHLGSNAGRSWAIILQQAWSMHLKDRIHTGDQNRQGNFSGRDRSNKNDYCRRFNKGRCTFGSKC